MGIKITDQDDRPAWSSNWDWLT